MRTAKIDLFGHDVKVEDVIQYHGSLAEVVIYDPMFGFHSLWCETYKIELEVV